MSFTYRQSTGEMIGPDFNAQGYSGRGDGLNHPEAQDQHGIGPLPQGTYTIGAPHADEKVGPIAMRLTPAPGNTMFGRGDFLIHGDNAAMNHSASEGCIILPKAARIAIGGHVLAGDDQLTVVA